MATVQISDDVLTILSHAQCDGEIVRFEGQLERKVYLAMNKVLEGLGGKWDRKRRGHVFDCDASELVGDAVSSGQYTNTKQQFQFFETPSNLASEMCGRAVITPNARVLEPSAGKGAIAKIARTCAHSGWVQCVEIQEPLALDLRDDGLECILADFLSCDPDPSYNAVVMNPPFTKSQDIDHVQHAYQWLAPGGRLVAIMSLGWTFRTDRKAQGFRDWLHDAGGRHEELPADTFKQSGTSVRTTLVEVQM